MEYPSNYNKYTRGGALNPFWVEDQCRQRAYEEQMSYEADSAYIAEEQALEARMQFLRNHSGSPEDLAYAKMVLGIKD